MITLILLFGLVGLFIYATKRDIESSKDMFEANKLWYNKAWAWFMIRTNGTLRSGNNWLMSLLFAGAALAFTFWAISKWRESQFIITFAGCIFFAIPGFYRIKIARQNDKNKLKVHEIKKYQDYYIILIYRFKYDPNKWYAVTVVNRKKLYTDTELGSPSPEAAYEDAKALINEELQVTPR